MGANRGRPTVAAALEVVLEGLVDPDPVRVALARRLAEQADAPDVAAYALRQCSTELRSIIAELAPVSTDEDELYSQLAAAGPGDR